MTTDDQKSELLEQFRQYLEQKNIEVSSMEQQADLHNLFGEIAALKTEVKTESRQFKSALDSLTAALTTVRQDNKTLSTELDRQDARLVQQQHEITRTLLLDIVDIYERLTTSLEVLNHYRPVNALFNHSKKKDIRFIENFKNGQEITVRRFEQLLQRYRVETLDCVGKPLNPNSMNAVETGHDPSQENGIVLEELRKGFLFQDQVLRLAEVKVNKINTLKTYE